MMEAMRFSVAPDNIKVTISNPGPVTSNWFERMEDESASSKSERPTLLADKMTEVERGILQNYRNAHCQSAESCAESIADVIERERIKRVDQGKVDVQFWNGTSEEMDKTVSNVKRYPSGFDGPVYEGMWNMAFSIAKAAREAPIGS
jgi:NAD(P)-dependent dehydrogenase (short-subunit alcohol dehydrogenase family)